MFEIPIGPSVPRCGNAFTRGIGTALLRLYGWRMTGEVPDLAKAVVIFAPHTSNWDFFFGVCGKFALGIEIGWIGKHTLFRWPFAGFMRWLGGEPVRRDKSIGRVAQIVEVIRRHDRYFLGLSPEGTRKKTERWRTGFYHVAVEAGVPILMTYLDYRTKTIGLGPVFRTTGDAEVDMAALRSHYVAEQGKYPEKF